MTVNNYLQLEEHLIALFFNLRLARIPVVDVKS